MFYRNQHNPFLYPYQQQMYPSPFVNQPQQQYGYHGPYYPPGYELFYQWQGMQPPQTQPHQQFSQPKTQQGVASSPLNFLNGADGSFDFQKAMNSFDQVMKTANQLSPLMKQLGSLFTPKN